jgi:hypothetical protein
MIALSKAQGEQIFSGLRTFSYGCALYEYTP